MESLKLTNNTNILNVIVLTSVILIIGLIIYNYYKAYQLAHFDCGCGNTNIPPVQQVVQKCGPIKSNNTLTDKYLNNTIKQNSVVKHDKPQIALYYAMWCGHSLNFLSEWEKVKKEVANSELKNAIVCEEYDCDKNREICTDNKINGYPSLIFHKTDGTKIDFPNQPRTFELVMAFIKENL